MKLRFNYLIYILLLLIIIADSGFINPSPSEFLPPWMFWIVISCAAVFLIIDRFVPQLKDIYDSFKKLKGS
jgi:hypothetical protein